MVMVMMMKLTQVEMEAMVMVVMMAEKILLLHQYQSLPHHSWTSQCNAVEHIQIDSNSILMVAQDNAVLMLLLIQTSTNAALVASLELLARAPEDIDNDIIMTSL